MRNMFLRQYLYIYGTVNATKQPPVGTALGRIDTGIVRLLADEHLQLLAFSGLDEGSHIVRELRKTTLMHRTYLLSVNPHTGVGHRTLEHQFVHIALGHLEGGAVTARLSGRLQPLRLVETTISIFTKALEFPATGYLNRTPLATLLSGRTKEIPRAGVLRIGSTQVNTLGCGLCIHPHGAQRYNKERKISIHGLYIFRFYSVNRQGKNTKRKRNNKKNPFHRAILPIKHC